MWPSGATVQIRDGGLPTDYSGTDVRVRTPSVRKNPTLPRARVPAGRLGSRSQTPPVGSSVPPIPWRVLASRVRVGTPGSSFRSSRPWSPPQRAGGHAARESPREDRGPPGLNRRRGTTRLRRDRRRRNIALSGATWRDLALVPRLVRHAQSRHRRAPRLATGQSRQRGGWCPMEVS